jgi:hypothetical protein
MFGMVLNGFEAWSVAVAIDKRCRESFYQSPLAKHQLKAAKLFLAPAVMRCLLTPSPLWKGDRTRAEPPCRRRRRR